MIEYARYPMDWSLEKSEEARERFAYYQKLCALKKERDALKDGGFAILSEEGYTLAFARFTPKEILLTITSTDDKDSEAVGDVVKIKVLAHTSYLIIVEKQNKM